MNLGELTDDFLKAMQLLFQDRRVKVTIEVEDDETESIRANTALHDKLMRRMQNAEAGLVKEVDLNQYVSDASFNV